MKSIILPLILASFLLTSCSDSSEDTNKTVEPKLVVSMVVGDPSKIKPRIYPGTVRANQSVDLGFQVSGQLIEFPVDRGQELQEGDLVGRLDSRDLKNELDRSRAEFDRLAAQFERAKTLLPKGTISQSEFDKAKADHDRAKAQLAIDQKAFDDTNLYAPFTGRVAEKMVDNFENIVAKQTIISLQVIENIDIEVDIPEQDMVLAKIREGRPKSRARDVVVFPSIPDQEFDVTLKEFSTEADPNTQTYRVVLTMQAPKDFNILPGMTASFILRTPLTEEVQVMAVPSQSVAFDADGKAFLWVINENQQAVKQTVEVGGTSQGNIEVLKGLNPGDEIIIKGASKVQEGMLVRTR